MKRVLPDIINNDQTGFLKGRSIGENFSPLNSVISYTEQQNVRVCYYLLILKRHLIPILEWQFLEKLFAFIILVIP